MSGAEYEFPQDQVLIKALEMKSVMNYALVEREEHPHFFLISPMMKLGPMVLPQKV